MTLSHADGGMDDRRWYPSGDPVEWARTTRQTVFESVKRCMAHVFATSDESYVTDSTFRELNICVVAYARGLYALGQTREGAAGLILVAAKEACGPAALHPAIESAIEQWCREAGPEIDD